MVIEHGILDKDPRLLSILPQGSLFSAEDHKDPWLVRIFVWSPWGSSIREDQGFSIPENPRKDSLLVQMVTRILH